MSGHTPWAEIKRKKKERKFRELMGDMLTLTNQEKVEEFREKHALATFDYPYRGYTEERFLHARLISNEAAEAVEALQFKSVAEIAKELADVLYVCYGCAAELGIPLDEVFEKVHQSNMTKDTRLDEGGKIAKGDDYIPVDMETLLEKD